MCDHLRHLPSIRRRRREGFVRDDFTINELCHLPDSSTQSAAANQSKSTSSSDTVTKRQETEFMYAQILRDILVKNESTEKEMVEFCRQKFAGNETDLQTVDEFEEYYEARNAIFWYTRDTFLYRLLNKALREQDFDTLYSLRYFIKDLRLQLISQRGSQYLNEIRLATTSNASISGRNTVYRGQLMTNEEFNKKIRNNQGFLSVNNFFSTTIHKQLAMIYAGDRSKNETFSEESVLFEIEIGKSYFDYANISKKSAFEEDEEEILFSMGTVFRMVSINFNDEGFWDVKMHLNLEENDDLTTLAAHLRAEIISSSYPLLSLGNFFSKTANYDKAEQFYLLALNKLTINEAGDILLVIYNNLGFVYNKTGKQAKATEYYKKSIEICRKYFFSTIPKSAHIHYSLGMMNYLQGDYDEALSEYTKALELNLNLPILDNRDIAEDYKKIADVYLAQQNYLKALEMFEKSLKLLEKRLPTNHPSLAACYSGISQVYYALGQDDKANEYLNKTLEVQFRSLPSNHIDFATSYSILGSIYRRHNKLKEALGTYEIALPIQVKCLPSDHPDIVTTNNNILEIRSALHERSNN